MNVAEEVWLLHTAGEAATTLFQYVFNKQIELFIKEQIQ